MLPTHLQPNKTEQGRRANALPRMTRYLSLFFSFILLSCGPAGVGPSEIRLNRKITPSEVIGVWRLQQACLDLLAQDGTWPAPYKPRPGTPHEIEIREDGTCRFQSVREHYDFETKKHSIEYFDWSGTWSLDRPIDGRNCNELGLSFKERRTGIELDFTDLFKQVDLWHYWGDPDACQIMIYEKKNVQPSGSSNPLPPTAPRG